MDIYLVKSSIFLLAAFLNFLLAFLLWFRGKTAATFYCGWIALISCLYAGSFGLWYIFANYPSLFLMRMTWTSLLILPFFVVFTYHFTEQLEHIKIKSFLLISSGIVLVALALTTSLFVCTAYIKNTVGMGDYGPLEPLGRLYVIFGAAIGLINLIRYYFKSSGLKKIQSRYFILGVGIYSTASLIAGGIMPLMSKYFENYGINTDFGIEISSLFSFVWVGLTAYAILRYKIMDTRIILGRIGIYTLTSLTLIVLVLTLEFLNNAFFKLPAIFLTIVNSLATVFIFLPAFRFYEKMAGRYFYYTFYSLQKSLSNLIKELPHIIELNQLADFVNKSLVDSLQLDKSAVILKQRAVDAYSDLFKIETSEGFDKENLVLLIGKQNNFLADYLQSTKKLLISEEIPYIIAEKKSEKISELSNLKSDMDNAKISMFLPFFIKKELIGIIALGDKLTDEPYTSQEINLLSSLTTQLAVAFSNALSYQEIQKGKEELEKWYKLTIGREVRMAELKEKIKEMENKTKLSNG
ncbi:MAG: histidine kinase N-terminal 7TM domain-containing protein [Candidatus Paceibacterota bacterium]|jgi:hypothetical protein